MRVLRSTCYVAPDDCKTMVLGEAVLKVPIEKAAAEMETATPGALIVNDIFEMDDTVAGAAKGMPLDIFAITQAAHRRFVGEREERERNMAILYFWDAHALRHVSPGGVLTGTLPAPLTAAEIEVVLRQLARHPNYQGQSVLVISEDQRMVRMKDGKVEVVDAAERA